LALAGGLKVKRQKPGDSAENTAPLPPPDRKAVYVREMFGRIAQRYDRMNRLMTLGRDQAWRRYTVAQAVSPLSAAPSAASGSRPVDGRAQQGTGLGAGVAELRVLDVATGTGDLAFEVLRQHPQARVTGLDFVPEMLALAQEKTLTARPPGPDPSDSLYPQFAAGDALSLPFPDATFDAVVTGFALRNVTDIPAAFAEIARVTRPGGRVACLEIAKPQTPLFRQLFGLYFYRLVPVLGRWIAGEHSAYTYLPHSLTAFLTPGEIVEVMRRTGWADVRFRRLMMGTVAVHVGVRT
jgi:demethylmenaquinone methyltransferase/2-methoxy-6-polyprenyl-1,4-benzoquinol methylase